MLYTTRFAGWISVIALVASTIAVDAAVDAQASSDSSSQQSRAGATIDESRLRRQTTPVGCLTTEHIELDGVRLQVDRVAIEALGECRVTIKNSHIIARTAALTGGKASLTIENSIIEGALRITQESVASVRSSTIRGRAEKIQKGQIKDLGQNVWQ